LHFQLFVSQTLQFFEPTVTVFFSAVPFIRPSLSRRVCADLGEPDGLRCRDDAPRP
jgi:hypothetical protein